MDLAGIIGTLIDFIRLVLPLSIIALVLYKLFSPVRQKLADKYHLSWLKSCLLLNAILSFGILFIIYLYFYILGQLQAPPLDPESALTLIDHIGIIGLDTIRIVIAALIISFFALFFEFVAAAIMESQEKNARNALIPQLEGIVVAIALFIIIALFVFPWAFQGLFIYIFFGGISPLPI